MNRESFVCYVDEAGDEGFKFNAGSSNWFILAGVVIRKGHDTDETSKIVPFRKQIDCFPDAPLHWRKLAHAKRVALAKFVASLRVRCVAVCVDKTKLLDREKFQDRYCLYFYSTRLLIERVSWLCRSSYRSPSDTGNGRCRFEFSNRASMPYSEMRDYFGLLRKAIQTSIDWSHVEDVFKVFSPGQRHGLELADASAGALYAALQKNKYGDVESRYIEELSNVLYRHKGTAIGYGVKLFPREAQQMLANDPEQSYILRL